MILRGKCAWQFQKEAAHKAVRNLKGIVEIKNRIDISSGAKPEDVRRKVLDAMQRTASEDAKNIRVEIDGNKVALYGKVHSRAALNDAEWAAWATPHVTAVESHIAVMDD